MRLDYREPLLAGLDPVEELAITSESSRIEVRSLTPLGRS